ncbi:glutathione transferase [Hysterangium stoloniferum]|nr:glutathione transferase [Hysterangium stoloniferum]
MPFVVALFILTTAILLNYYDVFAVMQELMQKSQLVGTPTPVKLYGSRTSTCVLRLKRCEHKTDTYISTLHPFGQVPVLSDGLTQIFESRAISRYIAQKYAARGAPLIPSPKDLQKWARFEQAASIEQADFDVYASGIAGELVFGPMRGQSTDHKRVQTLNATLAHKLDAYERILSKQAYLAGDEVTLADLFHLPYGAIITKKLGFGLLTSASRPNVAR